MATSSPPEKGYRAIVEGTYLGKHGPYAVATCSTISTSKGNVTFSLDRKVWQEEEWPQPGTYVMLYGLREKRAGWRASSARFVNPGDIPATTSKL